MSIQVTPDSALTYSEPINSESIAPLTSAEKRQAYLSHLLELAQARSIDLSSSSLENLRDHAAVRVQEQTFPTTRDEEWRFTDLSDLLALDLASIPSPKPKIQNLAIAPFVLPEAESSRLVFVDGVYAPELSAIDQLPSNLVVGNFASLSAAQVERIQPYLGQQAGAEEVFTALNTAGLVDVAIVLLPKNLVVDLPLHLLFISTADAVTLNQSRCLIVAEPNSAVTLVEEYVGLGEGAYFTNVVTEIWVAENAQVTHNRIQRDAIAAFHIGKTAVSQAKDSRYTCTAINLGAHLTRHNLEIYQTGEQTETTLNGLTIIGGEQTADTHSAIALTKPYGRTQQLQKNIVGDRAHAIFNGKVFVPKAAQLTDAGQLNRNLLLSPKARVDTKPQLEIVADNVKCSHGATVSQLEEDEVFYLQSRGIDPETAQSLLVYAFAYEILAKVPLASLQRSLVEQVKAAFG